jgi:competence protein CoiA
MLYAICDDTKRRATPKTRGICPYCRTGVIAKCGSRYIWHWAHVSKVSCDPWREGETDWHRHWKSYFPTNCIEVSQHNPETNERHVADVRTLNGTVIEFQNSPLTLDQILSRETFYGKMFWIVNGLPFKERFWLGDEMPSPKAELMKSVKIYADNSKLSYNALPILHRHIQVPRGIQEVLAEGKLLVQQAIEQKYDGHRLFHWQRPRAAWYFAEKPVIFDFGDTGLFRLMKYPKHDFFVVKQIEKDELILKNGGSLPAEAAAQNTVAT